MQSGSIEWEVQGTRARELSNVGWPGIGVGVFGTHRLQPPEETLKELELQSQFRKQYRERWDQGIDRCQPGIVGSVREVAMPGVLQEGGDE